LLDFWMLAVPSLTALALLVVSPPLPPPQAATRAQLANKLKTEAMRCVSMAYFMVGHSFHCGFTVRSASEPTSVGMTRCVGFASGTSFVAVARPRSGRCAVRESWEAVKDFDGQRRADNRSDVNSRQVPATSCDRGAPVVRARYQACVI
jgi:hypothetical protein